MFNLGELQKRIENVQNILAKYKQLHLLDFLDDLEECERKTFIEEIEEISFDEMQQLFEKAVISMSTDVQKLDCRMQPIPSSKFESEENCSEEKLELYKMCGLEQISKGHVGVLLMAGGQGTRLGVDYPKGMYSIGLISGKSLFQVQAERIRRIEQLAKEETGRPGKITWYIMTSGPTVEPTKKFLKEKNYFGLHPNNVVIFQQGLLPCFDKDGKIFLDEKNKISLAPDGNGGIYRALKKWNVLGDMQERGIKCVHAHSVDNILIKVAEPVFIGYCTMKNADCGVKVVRKSCPTEAVGVVCQVDGQFQVVEYSEITDETAHRRDADKNLVFSAGNICNHFFTTEFLCTIADEYESELKLHVAEKKIPYIDKNGKKVIPSSPNGIKIEKFVFDVFPFSKNFVTWEVPRYAEFSALKNSDNIGKDCPSTARRDLFNLHRKYIEKAGGTVIGDEIEISPLLSYAGEGLESITKERTFNSPTYLFPDNEIITTNGTPN